MDWWVAANDGTDWVGEPLDSKPLIASGQIFRMAMYHANHPDGNYRMSNRVQIFDPPSTISWEPGSDAGTVPCASAAGYARSATTAATAGFTPQ